MLVWVFLSLLKLSENLVSVSGIERTSAFRCTILAPVLDKLHVRASTYQTKPMLECSALLRLIAPLLRSSAPVGYYTFACLCSIAWYLCSSASPQSAPTDQKQLCIVFDFFFFCLLLFIFICLF